jgi:hypothetical protein
MGNRVDDESAEEEAIRNSVLLTSDKLPHRFNGEQLCICKMLWDSTSRRFGGYKKKEEDGLDQRLSCGLRR